MRPTDARFTEIVTTESQFRAVLGQPSHRVQRKHIDRLDEHCRTFIARSPFVLLASADAAGNMDVLPKGDPAGFVRVLDDTTLAIPERPGNRYAATFSNLVRNRRVRLLFLIPGKVETLRVSGTAFIVRDHFQSAKKPNPLRDGDRKPWLSTIVESPSVTSLRSLKATLGFCLPNYRERTVIRMTRKLR